MNVFKLLALADTGSDCTTGSFCMGYWPCGSCCNLCRVNGSSVQLPMKKAKN